MITVNFGNADGVEITSRRFPKNSAISVFGKVSGLLGIGEPFFGIRIELIDEFNKSIFYDEDTTNVFGDYNFWVQLPDRDANLTIQLTSIGALGTLNAVVPIAVGDATVEQAPIPQTIETEFSTYLKIGFVLLVIVLLIYATKTVKELTK